LLWPAYPGNRLADKGRVLRMWQITALGRNEEPKAIAIQQLAGWRGRGTRPGVSNAFPYWIVGALVHCLREGAVYNVVGRGVPEVGRRRGNERGGEGGEIDILTRAVIR
jgi:hypothetical protein